MAGWTFEPGHTAVEFRARHMMVTWVRGHFKDVHGVMEFDFDHPLSTTFEGEIDVTKLWTGETERDGHLRTPDFFDVKGHPRMTFKGRISERTGDTHYKGLADLTIRGITRAVGLDVAYLGQWETPYWVGEENRGSMRRIGFAATTFVDRHDFGVSWQDDLPPDGVVVGNEIAVTMDVEAINDEDLARVAAAPTDEGKEGKE